MENMALIPVPSVVDDEGREISTDNPFFPTITKDTPIPTCPVPKILKAPLKNHLKKLNQIRSKRQHLFQLLQL